MKDTRNSTNKISSMLFASHYIPQKDREWSELAPSVTLFARTLNNNTIDTLRNNNNQKEKKPGVNSNVDKNSVLVNYTPIQRSHHDHLNNAINTNTETRGHQYNSSGYNNDNTGNTRTNSTNVPVTWPNAIHEFNLEFRFAIEFRKHQLRKMMMNNNPQNQRPPYGSHSSNNSISSINSINSISTNQGDSMTIELPKVCDIPENDVEEYIRTYQSLVKAERNQILLQFEQYTQYHQTIHVRDVTSLGSASRQGNHRSVKGSNDSTPPPPVDHQLHVIASIPGIADSKPLPQRGDWILLRPVCYISMPIMSDSNNSNNGIHHPPAASGFPRHTQSVAPVIVGWTPSVHVVDIRCTITNIARAVSDGALDSVTATWLLPEHDSIIRTSYGPLVHDERLFQLRIIPNNKEYERCMVALLWLNSLLMPSSSLSNVMLPLLFPTSSPSVQTKMETDTSSPPPSSSPTAKIIQPSQKLFPGIPNKEQQSFVQMVLQRTCQPSFDEIRSPIILTGPAGTGKTKTLLLAIMEILDQSDKNRILICTPSHTAANVITQRLASTKRIQRNELFRLLDPDRNIATIPIAILSYCYQARSAGGDPTAITDSFDIPPMDVLINFRVVVSTCTDAHLLYKNGFTNQQVRQKRKDLVAFVDKECTYLNCKASFDGIDEPLFTHFFMDEAAQATEPESLIPLSVVIDPEPDSRKVEIALVGDPRQLSPAIYSNSAATAGLDISWIERILQRSVHGTSGSDDVVVTNDNFAISASRSSNNLNDMLGQELIQVDDWIRYSMKQDGQEQLSVFLMLNYRGHPSFLMIPSSLFYSDRLQRAGYVHEEESIEQYWCQQLRLIESLAQPVTLTRWQQPAQKNVNTKELASTTNGRSGQNHDGEREEFMQYKQWNWPIHFRGVIGKDVNSNVHSTFSTDSWCNEEEANAVLEIIKEVTKWVSTDKIGVMAPFRGQVILIRKILRANNFGGVDVGTIEDYQSAERDVIVLSLTRSSASFVAHDEANRIGVFGRKQAKRCNVALTRAQNLLIVIGNPKVMVNDFLWRQFLWFCYRNVLWYGDAGGTLSSFSWREEMQVVNTYDILRGVNDRYDSINNGANGNSKVDKSLLLDELSNTVVMSTMERTLSQT